MSRAMKNSGIPWIGEIPEGWKVVRTKNVLECGKEIVGAQSANTQLLSLTTKGIRRVEIGSTSGKVPDSYDTYQVVHPGNMVFCLFDLDCSAVFSGVSQYDGMISPAYKVTTLLNNHCPKFYGYWFDYIFDGRKYMFLSKNIRYSLTYDEFAALGIVSPPYAEQQAIADFLDKKCAEIDQMVALQEKFIEELKAYKQSLITETVTKGLNPIAQMKDSGVEWIGEVPEGWKIVRIKNILKDSSLQTSTGLEEQLSVTQNKGIIKSSEVQIANPSMSQIGWKIVQKGDIVFNKYKAHSGVFFVSPHNGIVTFNYSVYHCSDAIVPKFYEYVFKTPPCISEFRKAMKGVGESISPLYTCDLFSINIFLPPLSQQQEMTNYITAKNKEIDELILIKQKKIEELKEYKKSLIYEYVTGKKEVSLWH